MAKRKTPKAEKVIDLTPKAEKITDEQLKQLQTTISNLNRSQLEIGINETRKHNMLHNVARLNDELTLMQNEFEKDYGTFDVDIQTGTIKYPDNGKHDKKD